MLFEGLINFHLSVSTLEAHLPSSMDKPPPAGLTTAETLSNVDDWGMNHLVQLRHVSGVLWFKKRQKYMTEKVQAAIIHDPWEKCR